mmetsp:Transcript_91984/g.182735  ORF Transcript_91984/g.182735 Transcript_91984/m.182735 type:complete len:699 (+) Transcript_91984:39-2135(+)
MTLGTCSFVLLRERGKWLSDIKTVQVGTHVVGDPRVGNGDEHFTTTTLGLDHGEQGFFDFLQLEGTGMVLSAASISALASILAERIYKGQDIDYYEGMDTYDNFYVMKVHIDFSSLVFSIALWAAPLAGGGWLVEHVPLNLLRSGDTWFGPWTWHQILQVCIAVGQGWVAGIVTQQFSTVCKSIVQTLSTIVAVCVFDPLENKYHFHGRAVPSMTLAIIVVMSAMIFQTGRINGRVLDRKPSVFHRLGVQRKSASDVSDNNGELDLSHLENLRPGLEEKVTTRESEDEDRNGVPDHEHGLGGYILIVTYIGLYAIESLLKQYALSRTPIVGGTMNLMTFVLGVAVASAKTLSADGLGGLMHAWNPLQVMKFLLCGILFACSQAMVFMAFALHVPASIVTILGFVYTPISAVGKFCVMKKTTIWLQWIALSIVTLASMTFGFLQSVAPSKGAQAVSSLGLLCVIGSATLSAFASLTMEKFLKDEHDPFYMQKIALDLCSCLASIFLLPLSGFISHRPQDAFWRDRPLTGCEDDQCWGHVGSNTTCANPDCSCECGSGLFVAWDSWWVIITLGVITLKAWFKGEVTKRTSTLEVAVAESFGPLLIYFVGEPLVFGQSLNDWALNTVVFIAPLSALVFNAAAFELEKVIQDMKAAGLKSSHHGEDDGGQLCPLEHFLENLKEDDDSDSSLGSSQDSELGAL